MPTDKTDEQKKGWVKYGRKRKENDYDSHQFGFTDEKFCGDIQKS
jgi:hypothetical protein